jgi:hypothetical protein
VSIAKMVVAMARFIGSTAPEMRGDCGRSISDLCATLQTHTRGQADSASCCRLETQPSIYLCASVSVRTPTALRQAIDAGWRVGWWWELKLKPNLELLYDEPEFQAMVAEIEADMAAQLARVREMERNGELEPIPDVSATTH